MIITTEPPSEAWKILSGMIYDESKMRNEFEQLTLREGEESVNNYIARAKSLMMKLGQHGMT